MMFSNSISLATWAAITLFVFISSLLIARSVSMRPILRWICASATALATWSILSLYAMIASPEPYTVTITSPLTGIELRGYRLQVSGTVEPRTARVTVAVRSESDTRWWIQQIVDTNHHDGTWSLPAIIGTPSAGKEETFELIGLASNETDIFNVLTARYLYQGLTVPDTPRWNRSAVIVIRRMD